MKIKFTTLFLSLLFILFALIIPTKTLAANKSVEGWYKTTYNLVMRDSNGKKIISIPAKSIVQVKGKDPNNSDRLMVTYNMQTGSVLNSGLVKTNAPATTTSVQSTTISTTTSSNTTKKQTTSTTKNSSTTISETQSYKTTYSLVMRDSNGKKIISIPAKSIVQVKGKDSKNPARIIVTYNGKTGSVLNSGLQQITTTTSITTNKTTTTTPTTTSKNSTLSTTSTTTKYTYYARTKSECKLCDENGKTLKELKKNEFVKVISSGKKGQVYVDWYGKIGFITTNNIEKISDGIFISIEKQKQTLIRNGNLIITTPIVTGTLNKTDTPKGAFSIIQMKKIKNGKPITLSGSNPDGTTYTSYVDYWMRIYRGVGIHDAYRWRSKYGGEIYKTNGSHGCINTPKNAMKVIYENSKIGLPVYVQ